MADDVFPAGSPNGQQNAGCGDCSTRRKKRAIEMVVLSHGRSIPRSIYPRFRLFLHFCILSMLLPFLYLAVASFFSTADLLATATFFYDVAWTEIKPNPLLKCAARCWTMAYTLIATTITWMTTPILALLVIPVALEHVRLGRVAIRCGADPYGSLKLAFTVERIASFGQALRVIFGIVFYCGALWFMLQGTQSAAGNNWGLRRGVPLSPPLMAMGFSFLLGIVQFLAVTLIAFIVFALVAITKPFYRGNSQNHV